MVTRPRVGTHSNPRKGSVFMTTRKGKLASLQVLKRSDTEKNKIEVSITVNGEKWRTNMYLPIPPSWDLVK